MKEKLKSYLVVLTQRVAVVLIGSKLECCDCTLVAAPAVYHLRVSQVYCPHCAVRAADNQQLAVVVVRAAGCVERLRSRP